MEHKMVVMQLVRTYIRMCEQKHDPASYSDYPMTLK